MPIYEYKCDKCGAAFEALVFGQQKVTCEKCGSPKLTRLVSTFSAIGSPDVMPSCKGSMPACSRSCCESGRCPSMR